MALSSNKTNATSTYWSYPDYLGSTNILTTATGTPVESTTYYPFGGILTDGRSSAFNESRKYIGQQYDAPTSYNYLNARYYNSGQGQFISEDPIFLGNPNQQRLGDPQSLNAYNYANNNPITRKDPSGKQFFDLNGSFTSPLPEIGILVPVGITTGLNYVPDNGDSYVYFGLTISNTSGFSGALTYTPVGVPSTGFSISGSAFGNRNIGGQLSSSDGTSISPGAGIGSRGQSLSLTYTAQLQPFQYVTTPMASFGNNNNQVNFNPSISIPIQTQKQPVTKNNQASNSYYVTTTTTTTTTKFVGNVLTTTTTVVTTTTRF